MGKQSSQIMCILTALLFVFMSTLAVQAYDFESNGIYYNILSSKDKTVEVTRAANKRYSGDIIIPTTVNLNGKELSVVAIGDEAFGWCSELTSITLGDSVKRIGHYAFTLCNKLKNLTLGSNINIIGKSAFEKCYGLTRIEIPSNIETIGSCAFWDCDNVKEIIIHNGVKIIGPKAFYNNNKVTNIFIPTSVEEIGSGAFYDCDNLKVLKIEDSEKELILDSSYPWSYHKLDQFYLGRTPKDSFEGWGEITAKEIIIGSHVNRLRWRVCINLETITLLGTTPPESKEFTEEQYATVKVNVPQEAIPAYQATEPWNKFWSLPNSITQAEVSNDEVEAVYTLNGKCYSSADKGVLILKMKSGKTKKVVK